MNVLEESAQSGRHPNGSCTRDGQDHEKIAKKASGIDCFDFSGDVGIRLQ
jgi:hypothetical protein